MATNPTSDPVADTLRAIAGLRAEVKVERRARRRTVAVVVVAILAFSLVLYRQNAIRHDQFCALADSVDQQRDNLLAASAGQPSTPERDASIRRYNADTDALIRRITGGPLDC